jgi:hypothetical protein
MDSVPPGVGLVTTLLCGRRNLVHPKTRRNNRSLYKPQWRGQCRAKSSLLEAVWFFDQYPPISVRKQRDYKIWRKMVMGYIRDGYKYSEIDSLAAELSSDGRTKNVAKS